MFLLAVWLGTFRATIGSIRSGNEEVIVLAEVTWISAHTLILRILAGEDRVDSVGSGLKTVAGTREHGDDPSSSGATELVSPSVNQSVSLSVSLSVSQSVGQSVSQSVGRSIGPSVSDSVS
jgi:hypothetical protein